MLAMSHRGSYVSASSPRYDQRSCRGHTNSLENKNMITKRRRFVKPATITVSSFHELNRRFIWRELGITGAEWRDRCREAKPRRYVRQRDDDTVAKALTATIAVTRQRGSRQNSIDGCGKAHAHQTSQHSTDIDTGGTSHERHTCTRRSLRVCRSSAVRGRRPYTHTSAAQIAPTPRSARSRWRHTQTRHLHAAIDVQE